MDVLDTESKKEKKRSAVVAPTFSPSTPEAEIEAGGSLEF